MRSLRRNCNFGILHDPGLRHGQCHSHRHKSRRLKLWQNHKRWTVLKKQTTPRYRCVRYFPGGLLGKLIQIHPSWACLTFDVDQHDTTSRVVADSRSGWLDIDESSGKNFSKSERGLREMLRAQPFKLTVTLEERTICPQDKDVAILNQRPFDITEGSF